MMIEKGQYCRNGRQVTQLASVKHWSGLVWLLVALLASGCAGSVSHERLKSMRVTTAQITNSLLGPKLASGVLPGGGRFTVTVESSAVPRLAYDAEEPARYKISYYRKRGMVLAGGGGGVRLSAPLHATLEINIYQGCTGPYPYALAFGVLHDVRDSVTAKSDGDGETVRFKMTSLPRDIGVHGELVYALLGPGQNDIVTQSDTGRTVLKETRDGRGGVSCRG